jgi:hypothetical protein
MRISPYVANVRIRGSLSDPTVLAGTISPKLRAYLQVPAAQTRPTEGSPGDDAVEVTLPITFGETVNFITRFCTVEVGCRPTLLGFTHGSIIKLDEHTRTQNLLPRVRVAPSKSFSLFLFSQLSIQSHDYKDQA